MSHVGMQKIEIQIYPRHKDKMFFKLCSACSVYDLVLCTLRIISKQESILHNRNKNRYLSARGVSQSSTYVTYLVVEFYN